MTNGTKAAVRGGRAAASEKRIAWDALRTINGLRTKTTVQATRVSHHRNGIGGAPFSVVLFQSADLPEPTRNMVGVVFDEPAHVAVFDVDLLGGGVIGFGENSWRGDVFEPALRDIVKAWEASQE